MSHYDINRVGHVVASYVFLVIGVLAVLRLVTIPPSVNGLALIWLAATMARLDGVAGSVEKAEDS